MIKVLQILLNDKAMNWNDMTLFKFVLTSKDNLVIKLVNH